MLRISDKYNENEPTQLFCGDCLEEMKKLPNNSIDLILTDLPYGVTHNKWDTLIPFEPLWNEYRRIAKEKTAIILFASGIFTADLMQSNRKMWRYNLVWEKITPTGFLNANRMPLRGHEDICVFYKKLPDYHIQKTLNHPRKVSSSEHKRNGTVCSSYHTYNPHIGYDSTERYPTSVLRFASD